MNAKLPSSVSAFPQAAPSLPTSSLAQTQPTALQLPTDTQLQQELQAGLLLYLLLLDQGQVRRRRARFQRQWHIQWILAQRLSSWRGSPMGLLDWGIWRLGRGGVDNGCEVDLGALPIYHNYDWSPLYSLQGNYSRIRWGQASTSASVRQSRRPMTGKHWKTLPMEQYEQTESPSPSTRDRTVFVLPGSFFSSFLQIRYCHWAVVSYCICIQQDPVTRDSIQCGQVHTGTSCETHASKCMIG